MNMNIKRHNENRIYLELDQDVHTFYFIKAKLTQQSDSDSHNNWFDRLFKNTSS